MIIAIDKKKTNIAEYILYMWQVEDTIRGFDFDINQIDKNIINRFHQDEIIHKRIKNWYADIADTLKIEGKEKSGHVAFVNDELQYLYQLHLELINSNQETEYQKIAKDVTLVLTELRKKEPNSNDINDIELSFNILYGIWMLRLKKQHISDGTNDAANKISKMISELAKKYHSKNK